MTELQPYQPNGHAVLATDPTGGRLVAWAAAAQAANQLAKALARTSFVPEAFRGKEYDATAAIIMGDELGLSPLAALRSIYVIHGTPAMYARTMVALAQSHGHQVWTDETTDAKVTVCGQRKGSDKIERSTWTISRAQKAGYTNNKKYASNPQEMLYAKAAAEVARKVAADSLAGIPYSVEDLELEQPAAAVTVTRNDRKTPVKRAAPSTADAPEPAEPDLEPAEVAAELPEPISPNQRTRLHILFDEIGIDKDHRDERLAYTAKIIERTVKSSNDLTETEAQKLIDHLVSQLEPAPEEVPADA